MRCRTGKIRNVADHQTMTQWRQAKGLPFKLAASPAMRASGRLMLAICRYRQALLDKIAEAT
jgi:hypothetical protein